MIDGHDIGMKVSNLLNHNWLINRERIINQSAQLATMTPDKPTLPGPCFKYPQTVSRTLLICDYINSLGFSPKEFMITFLSSNNPDIDHRRRMMKVGLGMKGTRSIFKNLVNLTKTSNEGREQWEALILDEVGFSCPIHLITVSHMIS